MPPRNYFAVTDRVFGNPDLLDSTIPQEERMQTFLADRADDTPDSVAEEARRYFPQISPGQIRSAHEQHRRQSQQRQQMETARQRHADDQENAGDVMLRSSIPVVSSVISTVDTVRYYRAKRRIEAGNPEPGDFDIVAAREQRDQNEANAGTGEKILRGLAHIPALVGETMIAGGVISGGMKLAGLGARAAVAGTGAAVTQGVAAQAAPSLLTSAGIGAFFSSLPARAAHTAAITALSPAFYLERSAQNASENGGEFYNFKNMAPAYGMGVAQLGVMQLAGSLGQKTLGGLVGRASKGLGSIAESVGERVGAAGAAAPVGMALQAVVDAFGGVTGMQKGYGIPGLLAEGKTHEAMQQAVVQAVTFAAFGAMHGAGGKGKEYGKETLDTFRAARESLKKQGFTDAEIGNRLNQVSDIYADALNRQLPRGHVEVLADGIQDPQMQAYGRALANEIVDTTPAQGPGVPPEYQQRQPQQQQQPTQSPTPAPGEAAPAAEAAKTPEYRVDMNMRGPAEAYESYRKGEKPTTQAEQVAYQIADVVKKATGKEIEADHFDHIIERMREEAARAEPTKEGAKAAMDSLAAEMADAEIAYQKHLGAKAAEAKATETATVAEVEKLANRAAAGDPAVEAELKAKPPEFQQKVAERAAQIAAEEVAQQTKPAEAPVEASQTVKTGDIGKLGNAIGGGLTSGMYDGMYKRYSQGSITEAGVPSVYLQVAQAIKRAGKELSRTEFETLVKEIEATREGKAGQEFQQAMKGVVEKWSASEAKPAAEPVVVEPPKAPEPTAESVKAAEQVTAPEAPVVEASKPLIPEAPKPVVEAEPVPKGKKGKTLDDWAQSRDDGFTTQGLKKRSMFSDESVRKWIAERVADGRILEQEIGGKKRYYWNIEQEAAKVTPKAEVSPEVPKAEAQYESYAERYRKRGVSEKTIKEMYEDGNGKRGMVGRLNEMAMDDTLQLKGGFGELTPESGGAMSKLLRKAGDYLGGLGKNLMPKEAAEQSLAERGVRGITESEAPQKTLRQNVDGIWDYLKVLGGATYPTIARYSEAVANQAARLISVGNFTKRAIGQFAEQLFPKNATPELIREFGTAHQEMRLRYATDAKAEKIIELQKLVGQTTERKAFNELQREIGRLTTEVREMRQRSFVGKDGSAIPTEAAYKRITDSAEFKKFDEVYVDKVVPIMEEYTRKSQGLEADDDIKSYTQIPGKPIHAIAIMEGEHSDSGVSTHHAGSARGKTGAQKTGPYQWGKEYSGDAPAYETDAMKVIEQSISRPAANAEKTELYKVIEQEGVGKRSRAGQKIDGMTEVRDAFPRGAEGETSLYVKNEIYPELRKALALDQPWSKAPGADALTKISLASLVEGATHAKNIFTQAFKPGWTVGNFLSNLSGVWNKAPETQQRILDLAKMGAMREGHMETAPTTGPLKWMGKMLDVLDTAQRLTLEDAFNNLKKKGWDIVDSEVNKRDFINQIGQYNKKAQNNIVVMLRDTGIGPFATAGTNYTAQGVKALVGGHGLQTKSWQADAGLRAVYLTKMASLLTIAPLANYLINGNVFGDENTPMGAVKIGEKASGETRYLDLASLTGFTRGARTVGLLALAEGARSGQSIGQIATHAQHDIEGALIHPAMGPAGQFLHTLATGRNSLGSNIAPTNVERGAFGMLPQSGSRAMESLRAAVLQANPVVSVASGANRPGRDVSVEERVMQGLGPLPLGGIKFRGGELVREVRDRLQELRDARTVFASGRGRLGEAFPQEQEYRILSMAEHQLQAMDSQLHGQSRVMGRTVVNDAPSDERQREIRQRQAELARQALRRARER